MSDLPGYTEKEAGAVDGTVNGRPGQTDNTSPTKPQKSRFRSTVYALLAALPSRRSNVRLQLAMAPRDPHRRRSTMDVSALEQNGVKMRFEEDETYNELHQMQQIEAIKKMPVSMAHKRKLRAKVFAQMPEAEDSSCRAFCYKQRVARYRSRISCKKGLEEFQARTTLWKSAFKTIEGHFGSGVLSYFVFLKSLFMLNIAISLAIFLFVVVPMIAFPESDYSATLTGSENLTDAVSLALNCSERYVVTSSGQWYEYLLNLLQGTGFMEQTIMFYGHYSDRELYVSGVNYSYNLPFAYLTCVHFMLLFSLGVMVTRSATAFRSRLLNDRDSLKKYSNMVFSAWDYTLEDEKNSVIKHKSFAREVEGSLALDRDRTRRTLRSDRELCRLWTVRIVLNLVVLGMLGGGGYLIYYTTITTVQLTSGADYSTYHLIVQFLIEYMTSLTITALNSLLPIIFKKLITFEDYTSAFSVNFTLARTVFLRLASLAVVISSLYVTVTCSTKDECNVGTDDCTAIECWETYVGQELYKLVVMDFIVVFAITLFVEFPRRLIVSKCSCKVAKIVGYQEFDISKNVLDLVYSETLLWLGAMFSPMIPVITVVKNFIVFYLKMATTLKNYAPSTQAYRASDSEQFFQSLLLCSFTACVFPTMYVIWRMTPSRGCGPFSIYSNMIDIVPVSIESWPTDFVNTIHFIWSAGVIICLIIALSLVIHYLNISIRAYKDVVVLMKNQLYLESQDKRFLMSRVQELTSSGCHTITKVAGVLKSSQPHTHTDLEAQRPDSSPVNGHIESPPNVPIS